MPASKSEQVLLAFQAALVANVPAGALQERNDAMPSRVPAAGYVVLRDGDPGDPDVLLSPTMYIYAHRAEVDILVEKATPAERDALFDSLKQSVGAAVAADRTLGGLCDYVEGEAPAPLDLPVEGAEAMKAATIGVVFHYDTPDPLT